MRCAIYEQALTKQGVEWKYEEAIPLDSIDAAKGLRNQARLETPIDKELVEQYQQAMKGGDQFPPLVLWRPGKGRYIPVDGNQRLQAKTNLNHKVTDAYILVTEDRMVADRLTWSFNNLVNGKRLSAEECLQHAVTFVRKYGMTHAAAAKEWGIPNYRVKNAVKVLELKEVLERQNVNVKGLHDDKIIRLSPLHALGEDVFAKAADAANRNGMTGEQCLETVAKVKAAKSGEAKLAAIEEYTKSPDIIVQRAQTKGGTSVPKVLPRDKLVTLLGQMTRLLEEYPAAGLRPVPHLKYKTCREQAEYTVNALILVFGLGAVLPKEETA